MAATGKKKEENPQKKPPLNNYIKYSALGFQMLAAILLGVLGGIYLDGRIREPDSFRLYTVIGSLLGVFLALYIPLRELLKK